MAAPASALIGKSCVFEEVVAIGFDGLAGGVDGFGRDFDGELAAIPLGGDELVGGDDGGESLAGVVDLEGVFAGEGFGWRGW